MTMCYVKGGIHNAKCEPRQDLVAHQMIHDMQTALWHL